MMAIGESRFRDGDTNRDVGGIPGMLCGALLNPVFAFDPKRHGNDYNLVFCDGHVSGMNPWLLFNPAETARIWNRDNEPHPELWVP